MKHTTLPMYRIIAKVYAPTAHRGHRYGVKVLERGAALGPPWKLRYKTIVNSTNVLCGKLDNSYAVEAVEELLRRAHVEPTDDMVIVPLGWNEKAESREWVICMSLEE